MKVTISWVATVALNGALLLGHLNVATADQAPRTAKTTTSLQPGDVVKRSEFEYDVKRSLFQGPGGKALLGARVVPEILDGKMNGLRLYSVSPTGLAAALGLRDGDRVVTINGKPVASTLPGDLLAANQDKVVLDVDRSDTTLTHLRMTYHLR